MVKKRLTPAEPAPLKQNPFAALVAKKHGAAPTPEKAPEPSSTPSLPEPSSPPTWGSQKIVLQRERKGRGGKTATRVRGLPGTRLEELATRLKKALGCGATIEDTDVILLGDVVERAAKWLRDQGATRVIEGN